MRGAGNLGPFGIDVGEQPVEFLAKGLHGRGQAPRDTRGDRVFPAQLVPVAIELHDVGRQLRFPS